MDILRLVMFATFIVIFLFYCAFWLMIEGLSWIMMFIGAYGVLWHSSVVILYYVCVISWIMSNYEVYCKDLKGLGFVIFLNGVVSIKHTSRGVMDYNIHPFLIGFFHIVTFIIGYARMQCSWWLMLYCDIPEWLDSVWLCFLM